MAIRIVRLGTPRLPDEGPRLGTVRRPPRGVPKEEFSRRDFYDVWLPLLAPSPELLKQGLGSETEKSWAAFERAFLTELKASDGLRVLDALAALSHTGNFSLGCYCADERHCHRSILRRLLMERGARISGGD